MKITAHPYLTLLLALAIAVLLSMALGSVSIPLGDLWRALTDPQSLRASPLLQSYATIFTALRLPRTALIALSGAALGTSGAAYQGIFRNPLADPYLIGVASGAGLGAVIGMTLRSTQTPAGAFTVPLFAFLGALATVAIVLAMARVDHSLPTTTLILAGVAVSAFASAVSSFLLLFGSAELRRALSWLFGGATTSGWIPVLAMLPYLFIGLGTLLASGFTLNVLQFGDEQAQQLGLNASRSRLVVVVAASLTAAAAISFTGIIGFVGLVVPHVVRLIWGADYRRVLPLSLLGGAAFLLLMDVAARTLLAPQELPVGLLTALLGAPFFLWILRRTRQGGYW
jgi:iron complex transport system permease protein